MEQRGREQRTRGSPDERRAGLDEQDKAADTVGERSPEEQAATARSLKPHSRSVVDLDKLRLHPPEGFTAPTHTPKKSRKWQFGIRSRNQPYEAMLCLYKAIAAQGGVWEIQPAEAGQFREPSILKQNTLTM